MKTSKLLLFVAGLVTGLLAASAPVANSLVLLIGLAAGGALTLAMQSRDGDVRPCEAPGCDRGVLHVRAGRRLCGGCALLVDVITADPGGVA